MSRNPGFALRTLFAFAALFFAFLPGVRALDAAKSDAPKPGEPTDPKAKKTFAEAIEWEKHRDRQSAIDDFRKANKQDGGHCTECMRRAYTIATEIGAYKDAVEIVREWLPQAQTDQEKAAMHYKAAVAWQQLGIAEKKPKCFSDSCDELRTALQLSPASATLHYSMGISLAWLHQDDAARSEFDTFLKQDRDNPVIHRRAERYLERVELARATMAPPFSITALDGQRVSMDSLAGKVVLIDFWATWCGPCREALPHIRRIAAKFEGQPFVVLSVSLDNNEGKWKDFVQKNGMTWLQYRDSGFDGRIAKLFNVNAIPATFTIDADGVLEDQHVGDADIEGKLKKLVARAVDLASRERQASATAPAAAPAK
jgi:thiol-disulfide isomerase/thioredoxin